MAEIIRALEITSLIHGGRGIGRHEGKAVFVPLTVPGDLVSCRVVKSKRRYIEAELTEIIQASPARREPPCPFFGLCGGCQWQQMPYQEQLRWKEKTFSDLMTRGKVVNAERIKSIVPAPDEWHYRNRVQIKCHCTENGIDFGFYRHGSHFVVDVDECRLVAPPIQQAMSLLRSELPNVPCPDCISQIDIACGAENEVRIIFHVRPVDLQKTRSWLQHFAARNQFNACIHNEDGDLVEVVHGEGNLRVRVDQPELELCYGPGGFVQVNSAQNRSMVTAMLSLLALDGTEHVLDLFCGMGNFSLPIARRAGKVVGVEDALASVASARHNATANNVFNVEFHAADAATVMGRYQNGTDLDLVVLDPPRIGNYQVSCELLTIRPRQILYVSCDPATLVRDLTPLISGGYEVVTSQAFDLFPQTWHIESMTLLKRL